MTAQTRVNSQPVKILLVEDDLGDADLTYKVFKESKTPLEIMRVRDGEDALAYLRKESPYNASPTPDMILLDLNMPKMSGLEVLEIIKADSRLKEIPVLILTCSRSDADRLRAYEQKANFYMVKPGDLYEFFELAKYVEDIWLESIKQSS